MKITRYFKKFAACTALASTLVVGGTIAEAADKHKIYLSMSYIGNDWQAEAANMVKAMAAHKSWQTKLICRFRSQDPTPSVKSSRSMRWFKPVPRRL